MPAWSGWSELGAAAERLVASHGLAAAFVLLALDDVGVLMPLPANLLIVGVGALARSGTVAWWQAVVVLEAAALVGTGMLYAVARWGGRPAALRYGRRVGMTPVRLARAEGWLTRHGLISVVVGRLAPGLRIPTTVACGVLGLAPRRFAVTMTVAALLHILVYLTLGYFVGQAAVELLRRVP